MLIHLPKIMVLEGRIWGNTEMAYSFSINKDRPSKWQRCSEDREQLGGSWRAGPSSSALLLNATI